jgi:ATP dependent DNA ligase domain
VNPFIKAAQLKQKATGYHVARAHALNHQTLQHLAGHHREKFLKAHKYIQANVITGIQVNRGVVSLKHDGISAYFYWEKGQMPFLFHMPSCGVEVGLPAAEELAKALEAKGHTAAFLVGELIVDQNRSHSYEVMRALNSPESYAALDKLHFAVFDVILLDRQEKGNLGYDERAKIVQGLPKAKKAYSVGFHEVTSLEELNSFYKARIQSGGEGIVLHEISSQTAYKVKPKFNIDLAIVGYVEGTEELSGHAVSIMGALVKGNSYQLICRVGVADPAAREPLFKDLSRNRIESSYLETDSDSRPIVWVKPTRVMELNAEEVTWEEIGGGEWTNAVLQLKDGKFNYQGQGVTFKPFHPTLERLRDDKPVEECTFTQLPGMDLNLRKVSLAKPANIFLREAYVKTLKGKQAVRKIVAWEQSREGFPSFVIHTVDYSADRAEPLKEDTKATDSRAEAEACIENWRKEEISKGWNKV